MIKNKLKKNIEIKQRRINKMLVKIKKGKI